MVKKMSKSDQILTRKQVLEIAESLYLVSGETVILRIARAVEKAVLESKQVKGMQRDKELLDWLADPSQSAATVVMNEQHVLNNVHCMRDAIQSAREAWESEQ